MNIQKLSMKLIVLGSVIGVPLFILASLLVGYYSNILINLITCNQGLSSFGGVVIGVGIFFSPVTIHCLSHEKCEEENYRRKYYEQKSELEDLRLSYIRSQR